MCNKQKIPSFRVIQKNLLFVVGLSQRLADVEVRGGHSTFFCIFSYIHSHCKLKEVSAVTRKSGITLDLCDDGGNGNNPTLQEKLKEFCKVFIGEDLPFLS